MTHGGTRPAPAGGQNSMTTLLVLLFVLAGLAATADGLAIAGSMHPGLAETVTGDSTPLTWAAGAGLTPLLIWGTAVALVFGVGGLIQQMALASRTGSPAWGPLFCLGSWCCGVSLGGLVATVPTGDDAWWLWVMLMLVGVVLLGIPAAGRRPAAGNGAAAGQASANGLAVQGRVVEISHTVREGSGERWEIRIDFLDARGRPRRVVHRYPYDAARPPQIGEAWDLRFDPDARSAGVVVIGVATPPYGRVQP